MVIKEELRLNKFVAVSIPSPRSYFERLGSGITAPTDYGGEEVLHQANKVDTLALMEDRDRLLQNAEASEE